MKQRNLILFLLIVACARALPQYTPVSSHYFINGLDINPAFAGSEEVLSVLLMYRNQWMGFEGSPVNQSVSIHGPLKNNKIALGINILNESIGIRNYTNFYLNYGYRVRMGSGKLSLGLRAGLISGKQSRLDLSEYDVVFSENSLDYTLPNFGLGSYYYTGRFFAGISIPSILGLRNNSTDGEVEIYNDFKSYIFHITSGYIFNINQDLKLQPSLLIKYAVNSNYQYDVNLYAMYRDFLRGGLAYRNDDAVIALLGIRATPQINIGVSYDYSISELSKYNNGSLEIYLQYRFEYKVSATGLRNF